MMKITRNSKSGWGFLLAIVAMAAVLSVMLAAQGFSWNIKKKSSVQLASDFTLKDLNGKKFRLNDYRGKKPVLLIFSTTWCYYCRQEIPHFKTLYNTYTGQGLEVVNIDINESWQRVMRFSARYNLPYRVLLDENGAVAEAYDVMGVPSLILIDKSGKILCRQCNPVEPYLQMLFPKR